MRTTFIFLTLIITTIIKAQVGHGSMSVKPMTQFYDECPTRGYTKKAILETYSTSFRYKGDLYMLSYEDRISTSARSNYIPYTDIKKYDIEIYARKIFIFKKTNESWERWSSPLFNSVTNGISYIEYNSSPGQSFILDNGWIILGLNYRIQTEQSAFSYPVLVLLYPVKDSRDEIYKFEEEIFMPVAKPHRRVKDVIQNGHKPYTIIMNDDTEIHLTFILEENEYGSTDIFEINDELGNSMKSSINHFPGEIY